MPFLYGLGHWQMTEAIQNQYYRCLLNLPFLTPEYLLQKELKVLPLKLRLFQATINLWIKTKANKVLENANLWWNFWLDAPDNEHNFIGQFKHLLSRPLYLQNTRLYCEVPWVLLELSCAFAPPLVTGAS